MAFDKKQIALSVAGILAGLTLTYLLWRVSQNDAAQNAQNAIDANNATESELANQQAQVASLPAISVPTIQAVPDNTPSTTDTSNQGQQNASDAGLEALITQMLSSQPSSVTSASTPIASIAALPIPTASSIPDVVVPTLENFGSSNSVQMQYPSLSPSLNLNVAKG